MNNLLFNSGTIRTKDIKVSEIDKTKINFFFKSILTTKKAHPINRKYKNTEDLSPELKIKIDVNKKIVINL